MANNIPSFVEKCIGAMLASAIGDAMGWPNESRANNTSKNPTISDFYIEWTRRTGGRYWSHIEKILPGEYSDDTQMILAVARSIIAGNWDTMLYKKELPFWLEYERGGGNALKSSAKSLKAGIIPWNSSDNQSYFNAGGNGAVMRILPHVISPTNNNLKDLLSEVIQDCIFTHGHPRAILGTTCYAYSLYVLSRKETVLEYGELIDSIITGVKYWSAFPDEKVFANWLDSAKNYAPYNYYEVWNEQISSMMNRLTFIKDSLKKGLLVNDEDVLDKIECFSRTGGAGDVAILASLYLASKYANNPVLGIKTAAFAFGTDTDTIASITGGLLGMLCGLDWIPTIWKTIQDYDCIMTISELLLATDKKEASKKVTNQNMVTNDDWKSSPIGKMRTLDISVIPCGKSGQVTIRKMQTALGQTLYLKKFERIEQTKQSNVIQTPVQMNINDIAKPLVGIFSLDSRDVRELTKTQLLDRITFKKVIVIIDMILSGSSDSVIARKLKVNEQIVKNIKCFIK